jgi:hypothetical protein
MFNSRMGGHVVDNPGKIDSGITTAMGIPPGFPTQDFPPELPNFHLNIDRCKNFVNF